MLLTVVVYMIPQSDSEINMKKTEGNQQKKIPEREVIFSVAI